jgi:hypothetical protein
MKRAPKNFFIPKFFPEISFFFQKTGQNFAGHNIILPENNKIFKDIPKTNAIINQKPLGKKCNLNDIFQRGRGKRALLKTWGACPPPRFLRP